MKIYPTVRTDRPSDRVFYALARLSRDKWLDGKAVALLGMRLARIASPGMAAAVYRRAVSAESEVVGLYRGLPPATMNENSYGKAIRHLRRRRQCAGDASPEILCLEIQAERNTHEYNR